MTRAACTLQGAHGLLATPRAGGRRGRRAAPPGRLRWQGAERRPARPAWPARPVLPAPAPGHHRRPPQLQSWRSCCQRRRCRRRRCHLCMRPAGAWPTWKPRGCRHRLLSGTRSSSWPPWALFRSALPSCAGPSPAPRGQRSRRGRLSQPLAQCWLFSGAQARSAMLAAVASPAPLCMRKRAAPTARPAHSATCARQAKNGAASARSGRRGGHGWTAISWIEGQSAQSWVRVRQCLCA
mmetsp:Transcript_90962/g.257560  ORF Transcript_90962/g.257560 Transcript_90962/m.257560 type:complete len:238 (+) Transcript_90962:210-923(+)